MSLDTRDHIQRMIYFGTYECLESKMVQNHVRPGSITVDVGANVGYYTAMFSKLVGPTGRVVAIEPSQYAFSRLLDFIQTNEITWAEPVNIGLSDVSGELPLFLAKDSNNHTPSMVTQADANVIARVPVRRLDDLANERGITQIDLLKIDVEGFEPQVLAGAPNLLAARAIKAILVEINEYWLRANGSSPNSLRATLSAFGFKDSTPNANLDTRLFVLNG